MKEVVYHGSPRGNLDFIKASKSTHQKECIYGSELLVVAMLFMGKGLGDLDTKISTLDKDKVELIERREGVLDSFYNKEGYIYELDGSTFNHYDYLWSLEVISFEKEIKALKKIYYKNILKALEEEEKKGNIIIYRYPSRPQDVPIDNSDLIEKFIRFEKNGIKGAVDRLLRVYPEFKEKIKKENSKD